MVFNQRELDFAGFVGLAQSPIAPVHFCGTILHHKQNYAGRENHIGEGSAYSHKNFLLFPIAGEAVKCHPWIPEFPIGEVESAFAKSDL